MIYEDNLRLSQIEYLQQHIYLRSQPRCLGLVLGNACNIDCPHCYQAKNGDNLLKPAEIGRELRREFMALYPYLNTLRVQGGEAFAYPGFAALIDDVAAAVQRPILSASTNGTLIDEDWAERIVRLPFSNLTVSIDGGTPETYARLRRGSDLGQVLANVRRIERWKKKLGSQLPHLDSFFVVMRSNFREIPRYLELMADHGFEEIALQTAEINANNTSREPTLVRDEAIAEEAEIRELHTLVEGVLPGARRRFRSIRTSGLTSLFEALGLSTTFLREETEGLYPDSGDLAPEEPASIPLCPNPWTTLFVAENGDVHLCFLAEPVGNLYEAPLTDIWNSPRALAKRSHMISGRYLASGCSSRWCSWRRESRQRHRARTVSARCARKCNNSPTGRRRSSLWSASANPTAPRASPRFAGRWRPATNGFESWKRCSWNSAKRMGPCTSRASGRSTSGSSRSTNWKPARSRPAGTLSIWKPASERPSRISTS